MKLTLPQSYEHVTIGQFQKIYPLMLDPEGYSENEFTNKMLSALCNETEETIKTIKRGDLTKAMETLDWMADLPDAENCPIVVRVQNVNYNVQHLPSHLHMGGHVNLEKFQEEGIVPSLHKIMAVLCTPKDYDKQESFEALMERADTFQKHMTISIAYKLAVFFSEVVKYSLALTQISLEKKIQEGMKELNQLLPIESRISLNGENGN